MFITIMVHTTQWRIQEFHNRGCEPGAPVLDSPMIHISDKKNSSKGCHWSDYLLYPLREGEVCFHFKDCFLHKSNILFEIWSHGIIMKNLCRNNFFVWMNWISLKIPYPAVKYLNPGQTVQISSFLNNIS